MTKLGQHFLKSQTVVDEIIKAAELTKNDAVLEVGPGKGILTEALLQTGAKVIAVEKDENLVHYLTNKFKNTKNLKLIAGDILKMGASSFVLPASSYKIVANIPYYITAHFLRQFLSDTPPTGGQPSLMVLMLQKEVAERIVGGKPSYAKASEGKESILSISVKAYGQPKIIRTVPASDFSPKPKVDSTIIKIEKISKNFFYPKSCLPAGRSTPQINEQEFFDLVKKGFSQKRKMLKNNLPLATYDVARIEKCGISEKARAQELNLEQWKCLYFLIHNRKCPSSGHK